jgi:adenine C2-methylase RlmN of 23S rRNA A2503 and tRNA A37
MSNAYNVALAISSWKFKYKEATFRLSSPGAVRSPRFKKKIWLAAETQDIDLRFSIHSTDHKERQELVDNPNVITFSEIAELSNSWPNPPITLNFLVLDGMQHDPEVIINTFDPEKVAIEIQPLIPNLHTRKLELKDASPLETLEFARQLKHNGFHLSFQME